uniref:Uncharacterized protein n=1 Tax=Arundo donax TaxID=35708 RepID=A0A0A8ZLQ2_ARUDO
MSHPMIILPDDSIPHVCTGQFLMMDEGTRAVIAKPIPFFKLNKKNKERYDPSPLQSSIKHTIMYPQYN